MKMSRKKKYVYRRRAILGVAVIAVICSIVAVNSREKEYSTYYVSSGETLWSIARNLYGDDRDARIVVDELQRLNNLDGCIIHPGDALVYEVR